MPTVTDIEWEEFKKTHNRKYADDDEEKKRREIFAKTKENIEAHNKKYKEGTVTFAVDINKFSDLTPEEFNKFSSGYREE